MTDVTAGQRGARLWRSALVCTAVGIAGLFGFFWPAVASGFRLLLGDLGDWRLCTAILEHWITFARADWSWKSPPMFFPTQGALASSDALLLFLPAYALGRALQFSAYHAMQFTMAVLLLTGFGGAVWLLRKIFCLPLWIAILGGTIYGFAGFRSSHLSHVQLYAGLFLPILLGAAVTVARRLHRGESGLWPALLLAAGTALLMFTSFYIGWFFILFLCLVALCWLVWRRLDFNAPPLGRLLGAPAVSTAIAAALTFVVALLPFLVLYLPAYLQFGPRPWSFAFQLLPTPADLVNVGLNNLVWGGAMGEIAPHDRFHGYEMTYGVAFGLLALFLGTSTVLLLFPRANWLGGINFDKSATWLRAFALSVVAAWLLLLRVNDHSAWLAVFHFVPGGSAIRAPYRFQVVLFLPLVIVSMFGLRGLWRSARRRSVKVVLGACCALLLAEQIQTSPAVFDAQSEIRWLKGVQPPPPFCRSFVLLPDSNRNRPWYAANLDAFFVAVRTRVPTINGYSGNFPAGWGLLDPNNEGYLAAVADWVGQNDLRQGLCTFQPASGVWRRVLPAAPENLLGVDLVGPATKRIEDALAFRRSGFFDLEPVGRWTNGLGTIDFVAPVVGRRLRLEGDQSNPFRGEIRLIVNGRVRNIVEPANGPFVVDMVLDEGVKQLQIDSATFVPALVGINTDRRQLGVLVRRLTLEP